MWLNEDGRGSGGSVGMLWPSEEGCTVALDCRDGSDREKGVGVCA
jgi:hypothetical protein